MTTSSSAPITASSDRSSGLDISVRQSPHELASIFCHGKDLTNAAMYVTNTRSAGKVDPPAYLMHIVPLRFSGLIFASPRAPISPSGVPQHVAEVFQGDFTQGRCRCTHRAPGAWNRIFRCQVPA